MSRTPEQYPAPVGAMKDSATPAPATRAAAPSAPVPLAQAPFDCAVFGTNHHHCPPQIRDRLYVPAERIPGLLRAIRETAPAPLDGMVLVATCDRIEFLVSAPAPQLAELSAHIRHVLCQKQNIDGDALAYVWREIVGKAAAKHWLRTMSALDSQTLGDPHIGGQIRQAVRLSKAEGLVPAMLTPLIDAGYRTARRVRHETALAQGPVTMAAAAVRTARSIFGDLAPLSALIVGDGEMGDVTARALRSAGLQDLSVADPRQDRAIDAAARYDCHLIPMADLRAALPRMDIIIGATSDRVLLATAKDIRKALRQRRYRPMFLIDAASPTDFDPAIDRLDDAFRYTLADLEAIAMDSFRSRAESCAAAEAIVAEELVALAQSATRADDKTANAGDVGPTMARLRDYYEAEQAQVLASVDLPGAAEATRLLINRLLHHHATALRAASGPSNPGNPADAARLRDAIAYFLHQTDRAARDRRPVAKADDEGTDNEF